MLYSDTIAANQKPATCQTVQDFHRRGNKLLKFCNGFEANYKNMNIKQRQENSLDLSIIKAKPNET